MERIGERLRRRREELGLTLEDVSEAIRYRPEIIRAIEEGRTNVFPAKAYLSAFLRAYAAILELDPADIVREQKSEEERAFEAIRNIRIKPKRRRKFPRRVLYILIPIVLAVVLLIVVDRFLWDREPVTRTIPLDRSTAVTGERDSADHDAGVRDAASQDSGAGATGEVEEREGAGEVEEPGDASERSGERRDSEIRDVSSGGEAGRVAVSHGEPDGAASGRGAEGRSAPAAETSAPATAPVEGAGAGSGDSAQPEKRLDVPAASEEQARPEVPLSEPVAAGGPRRHKLVVSARRGAYINLTSGGNEVYNGYFGGGEVDSFFSETRFVIVALTDRGAWTFVHDGQRVRLPGSSSEDVSNFVIPLPSGN